MRSNGTSCREVRPSESGRAAALTIGTEAPTSLSTVMKNSVTVFESNVVLVDPVLVADDPSDATDS